MIRFNSVNAKLQLSLSVAVTTNELPVVVSYSDKTSTQYLGNSQQTMSTGTTAVDICDAPSLIVGSSSTPIREIDTITIVNTDTTSKAVSVLYYDSGTTYLVIKATLSVGDHLEYTHSDGWKTIDSTGKIKTSAIGGAGGIVDINGDATINQFLVTGTAGVDFAIVDDFAGTHTFNLPTASALNRGALSSADWTTFNNKLSTIAGIAAGGDLSGTYVNPTVSKILGNTIPVNAAGVLTNNGAGVLTWGAGVGGTVTIVSVVSANGFAGTVATDTTTPAITLTTTISGVLAGNGTAISAATDADITGKLLTGYVSGAGVVAATDSILQAIQKLNGNAGGAVTITDDTTTNATMYPTWVTANTGSLPLYVSSTKISFNPSTGTLTTVIANVTTAVYTPRVIGGTGVADKITYKSTSGVGTTTAQAHEFNGGNNGATNIANLYNDGQFLVGTSTRIPNTLGIFRVGQGTSSLEIGESSAGNIAIWGLQGTNTTINYSFKINSSVTTMNNAGGYLRLAISGTTKVEVTANETHFTTTASTTATSYQPYEFITPSSTNVLLSTEINGLHFAMTGSGRQWSVGALTTQREYLFSAPTYRFTGASTITNAGTLVVDGAPIASTNATITNAYSLWIQAGKSKFGGNVELTQTVTTEVVVSNTTVTIVINGTTYKLLAKA